MDPDLASTTATPQPAGGQSKSKNHTKPLNDYKQFEESPGHPTSKRRPGDIRQCLEELIGLKIGLVTNMITAPWALQAFHIVTRALKTEDPVAVRSTSTIDPMAADMTYDVVRVLQAGRGRQRRERGATDQLRLPWERRFRCVRFLKPSGLAIADLVKDYVPVHAAFDGPPFRAKDGGYGKGDFGFFPPDIEDHLNHIEANRHLDFKVGASTMHSVWHISYSLAALSYEVRSTHIWSLRIHQRTSTPYSTILGLRAHL